MGSWADEILAGLKKADVENTGLVDVTYLHSLLTLLDDKISPADFLTLLFESGTCAIRYEKFIDFLSTDKRIDNSAEMNARSLNSTAMGRQESPSSFRVSPSMKWETHLPPEDNSKHRILITGATGLLGREVYKAFESAGDWSVCGTGLTRAVPPLVQIDLFDTTAVHELLLKFKPNVVIHCAAERQPDKIEGNQAWAMKINSELTGSIAKMCGDVGAWLVYLSTNYVFDGKHAPYAEDAIPCPANTYGESKKCGEDAMRKELPNGAILRIPLLYGPSKSLDESSVTQLVKVLKTQTDPKIDHWQERFPTYTCDVAQVLLQFANMYLKRGFKERDDFGGIFHWQACKMHTKYTMAQIVQDITCLKVAKIVPVETAPPAGSAPRPQFEKMLCTRLEKLLGIAPDSNRFTTDFEKSMGHVLAEFGPFTEEHVADKSAD